MKKRNVLITFLGTNRYLECNYTFSGQKVEKVKFVQEALVRLLCSDFSGDDRILVFLTDKAREQNWLDRDENGTVTAGLQSRLNTLSKEDQVKDCPIEEGSSPEELWGIFNQVYQQLNMGDRVFLDITHAFRSLPMLSLVLLHYARLLKDIDIAGIYYGAFETLGSVGQVKEMAVAERNAPIFDLSDFDALLDWSSGVEGLVRHGNPKHIAKLLKAEAQPRLKASRGEDHTARVWNGAAHYLGETSDAIHTNRGTALVEGAIFMELQRYLEEAKEAASAMPAFVPLLDEIKRKISGFQPNNVANCLQAVRWCLDHDLIQQGFTLLQEGIICHIAEINSLDWRDKKIRTLVSDTINVICRSIPESDWNANLQQYIEIARRLCDDPLVKDIGPVFDTLSQARNDINHGGFVEMKTAAELKKTLRQSFDKITALLSR